MKRVLVGFVVAYLIVGVVIAVATRPEQMWTCVEQPLPGGEWDGGEMNYMVDPAQEDPPREDCRKSANVGDQAQWIAFATPIWPILAANMLVRSAS